VPAFGAAVRLGAMRRTGLFIWNLRMDLLTVMSGFKAPPGPVLGGPCVLRLPKTGLLIWKLEKGSPHWYAGFN
jgi:hypothetical protein